MQLKERMCSIVSVFFSTFKHPLCKISAMTNYHELPSISFSPLTTFVCLSCALQFLQFVTMVTAGCRFLPVLFSAPVSAICETFYFVKNTCWRKEKKSPNCVLHTRLHEQTQTQANRQLLTKKKPLKAGKVSLKPQSTARTALNTIRWSDQLNSLSLIYNVKELEELKK